MSHTPDLEAGILSDGASYHSTASEPKPISADTLQSLRVHFNVKNPSPTTPPQKQDQKTLPPSPALVSPISPARSIKRKETDELISDWDAVRERLEETVSTSPTTPGHEASNDAASSEKRHQQEEANMDEFEDWRGKYVPLQRIDENWLKNMYLEDILWRGVQLQKEYLIMGSKNGRLASLQDHVRRDDIHEELCRFSQSLVNYDSFVKSPLGEKIKADLLPNDLDHKRSYVRDLAVLEATKFLNYPEEKAFVEHLENLVFRLPNSTEVLKHIDRMVLSGVREPLDQGIKDVFRHPKKWIVTMYKTLPVYKLSLKEWFSRVFVFVFTMGILLGPLAFMMVYPDPWYIFGTICVSTFLTGIVLSACMDEVTKVDIMATVAAYASVLIVGMGEAMTQRGESVDFE